MGRLGIRSFKVHKVRLFTSYRVRDLFFYIFIYTVEPLLTHTPRWMARAMGYGGLWVMRGHFWCKITIWFPKKLGVIRG